MVLVNRIARFADQHKESAMKQHILLAVALAAIAHIALALAPIAALAQFFNPPIGPGSIVTIGPSSRSAGGGGGGGGCTADGKTDWSNACDIPMGVALGVL